MTENKKDKALAALLVYPTYKEAAKEAGITERTIRKYLQEPGFAAEYRELRKTIMTEATDSLQKGLQSAIKTLREIVEDGKSETAKINASRALLEYCIRYTEQAEILDRIQNIERIFNPKEATS